MLHKALVFAVVLASPLAGANPIAEYQDAIDEHEAQYGAYDPALSELQYGLGVALQGQNEHNKAIDALKLAMQIKRVNHGIKSLAQEPMLRRLIESYEALDQPLLQAGNYQRLIDLYQQNHGAMSAKLVPILLEAGNWHRKQYLIQANDKSFAHLDESTKMLTLARTISRSSFGGNSTELLSPLQSMVKNHYYLVQYYNRYRPKPPRDYVRHNSRYFRSRRQGETRFQYQMDYDRHMRSEEDRLARRYQRELIEKHTNRGLSAYRTIASIHAKNGDARRQATALTEQGDWLLLFNRSLDGANSLYRQSWNLLNDNGDLETLDQLFAKPRLLPAFHQQNPADFSQLAKVQADINQTGMASNIKVLETVPLSNDDVAKKARQQLRQSQFRSRLENGEPVASQNVELTLFIDQ